MKNANMPAMPLTASQIDRSERAEGYEGLTKREYFAGLAMQAIIANPHWETQTSITDDAIESADALLRKLEQTK